MTTALFIGREGFRRGCLRFAGTGGNSSTNTTAATRASSSTDARAAQPDAADSSVDDVSVLRVAVLCVPFGLLVTAATCALALWQPASQAPPPPACDSCGPEAREAAARLAAHVAQSHPVPFYREAVLLHGGTGMPALRASHVSSGATKSYGPALPQHA